MAKELTFGQMARVMKEIGNKTLWMAKVLSSGKTRPMKANGKTTKCMAKASKLSKTAAATKESSKWIRSTGLAFTLGLMVKSTRAIGRITSSMEKADKHRRMEQSLQVSGKTESALIMMNDAKEKN